MALKDKLEIGLKPDAPYRPDNLPEFQRNDPACEEAGQPGESRRLRAARAECDAPVKTRRRKTAARTLKSPRLIKPRSGR